MKPLRPIDLADLHCDLCKGKAFTSEEIIDVEFMDDECFWRNHWGGSLPSCLCTACQTRMQTTLDLSPTEVVPIPPDKKP